MKKFRSVFRKKENYISDLYDVVHEMASGNLDIEMPQKLGMYEPFREELLRLQDGIRLVVAKELKSERMKMELIENVSHDLKTPLTAIITYVNLILAEDDPEKIKEYAEVAAKRADRLKILIEDLFEVTKASTGNIKFEPIEIDIVKLIKQVAVEYSERFLEKNLEIVYENADGKYPVYVDPQKTYRIYANLMGNIAKYSLKNSRVYVRVDEIGDEIIIVIKNVSASKLMISGNDLTERFVRGDTSRNTEGSGLGLAIAKDFTSLQGGTFQIVTDGDLFKAITIWPKTNNA